MDEHIIDGLGKSIITIRDGKVINVTEPKVKYCPLFDHQRGIKEITKEEVKNNERD